MCDDKSLIIVINKCDKVDTDQMYAVYNEIYKDSGINEDETIQISAKNGDNISALENMLIDAAKSIQTSDNDIIVTNIRHYEALQKALSAIRNVKTGLQDNLSGDLIGEDLRDCLQHLGEIVGEITNDEILGNIFAHFCIGK